MSLDKRLDKIAATLAAQQPARQELTDPNGWRAVSDPG